MTYPAFSRVRFRRPTNGETPRSHEGREERGDLSRCPPVVGMDPVRLMTLLVVLGPKGQTWDRPMSVPLTGGESVEQRSRTPDSPDQRLRLSDPCPVVPIVVHSLHTGGEIVQQCEAEVASGQRWA